MGTIITVAQSKGGAGKTSLVQLLAPNLAALGYRVVVLDTDRNQNFRDWHQGAYEGEPITCASEVDHVQVVDKASELAEENDLVLVDTAGFENLTAASAIGMADFVLIPCMADRGSIRETIRTAKQVASLARMARRSIPYSVVRTRWEGRELAERAALQLLEDEQLALMKQAISNLTAFKQLSLSGKVPLSGKVGLQADRLIDELVTIGAIPPRPPRQAKAATLASETV